MNTNANAWSKWFWQKPFPVSHRSFMTDEFICGSVCEDERQNVHVCAFLWFNQALRLHIHIMYLIYSFQPIRTVSEYESMCETENLELRSNCRSSFFFLINNSTLIQFGLLFLGSSLDSITSEPHSFSHSLFTAQSHKFKSHTVKKKDTTLTFRLSRLSSFLLPSSQPWEFPLVIPMALWSSAHRSIAGVRLHVKSAW